MVARTVTQYARSGVAGLHIEDQVQTKRCGHLMGKQVVSREEFITRIRAAVIARDSIPGGSDFVSDLLYRTLPPMGILMARATGNHRSDRFCTSAWNGGGCYPTEACCRRGC